MLSDSPPERDVEWTLSGVEGAGRHMQRIWRMVETAAPALPAPGATPPGAFAEDALSLRRTTHRAIAGATADIEGFGFNKAIARLYEFANAIATAQKGDLTRADLGWAMREALEALTLVSAPMIPHLAEEMWAALGREGLVAEAAWPEADAALARSDVLRLPVQVNGKKRAEIEVDVEADRETIEAAALTAPEIVRHLEGAAPRKVIVVPGRIVNLVL